jgi:Icc protein
MPGCDFTRRDLLRWSAVAAAAPAATGFALDGVAAAATAQGDTSPANLELVTLTEDRAIVTWYTGYTGTDDGLGRMVPAPADGEVRWGTHPDRLNRVAAGLSEHTPYHYVELTGLEPGQTYYYQARSKGKPVPPTPFTLISGNAVGTSTFGLGSTGPYSFTTPQPPPGRFLFSIALCNDLHMGERRPGLSAGSPSTSESSRSPAFLRTPRSC